jgi:hypothetical protein
MAIYAVTYDLMAPKQDYEKLFVILKSFTSYSKEFDSFWLIESKQSASDIRDLIKTTLDEDDKLFVIKVEKSWASTRISDKMVNWLKSENRNWS